MTQPRSTVWLVFMGVASGWGLFAVKLVTSFIRVRVLLSFLPDAEAGVWFTMVTILGYVQMLDFGAGVTLARYVAYARAGHLPDVWAARPGREQLTAEQQSIADLIATVGRYFRAASAGALGVFLVAGFLILPGALGGSLPDDLMWAWVLIALSGYLTLAGFTYTASLYGSNGVHLRDSVYAVTMLAGFGLMILFLSLGWGLIGVSLSLLIETALRYWLHRLAVLRLYPFLRLRDAGRAQWALLRAMLGPSVRMGIILVAEALILQTDNVIIAARLGPAAVPNYNVAFQLGFTLLSLLLVINTPLVSLAASAHAERDEPRLRQMLSVNLRFGFSLMLLGAALLAAFGDDVIALWVGPARFVGFPVLWLILLVMTLEAFKVFHFRLVTATDSIPFVPWVVAAALLNLAVSYALAPRWGWLGVTFGTLFSQAVTSYWYVPYHTVRVMKFQAREYARLLLPVLAFGLAAVLAAQMVSRGLDLTVGAQRPLAHLLAGVALVGLPAVAVAYRFLLLRAERDFLRAKATMVLGRLQPAIRTR